MLCSRHLRSATLQGAPSENLRAEDLLRAGCHLCAEGMCAPGVRAGNLSAADLRSGDLRAPGRPQAIRPPCADLLRRDLRSGNLRSGDLRSGDLRSGNLRSGNLRSGNLCAQGRPPARRPPCPDLLRRELLCTGLLCASVRRSGPGQGSCRADRGSGHSPGSGSEVYLSIPDWTGVAPKFRLTDGMDFQRCRPPKPAGSCPVGPGHKSANASRTRTCGSGFSFAPGLLI